MRADRRHDEKGIVGVILTLVLVFALVAVVELTRTLQAAQQIDTRVIDITGSVKDANSHLNTGCSLDQACTKTLPVLNQTESIVARIDAVAKPLTGEVGQILSDVNSINATAAQILTTATSINSTVHSINGVVGSINGTVNSIGGSINGINSTVVAIRSAPGGAIQGGISGINNRADVTIGLVSAIKGDTGTIRSQAGAILTQAHSISCDKVLGLTGPLSNTC